MRETCLRKMATLLVEYVRRYKSDALSNPPPDYLPPQLLVPLIDGPLLLDMWQYLPNCGMLREDIDVRVNRPHFAQTFYDFLRAYMMQRGTSPF